MMSNTLQHLLRAIQNNLVDGAKQFFRELGLPVAGGNYLPIQLSSLGTFEKTAPKLAAEFGIQELFLVGKIPKKELSSFEDAFNEEFANNESRYETILFFALDLPQKDQFTYKDLKRIAYLFNRTSEFPIVLIIRYFQNSRLTLTASERVSCKQGWRVGKKVVHTAVFAEINPRSVTPEHLEILERLQYSNLTSGSRKNLNKEWLEYFFTIDISLIYELITEFYEEHGTFPIISELKTVIGTTGVRAIRFKFDSFTKFLKDTRWHTYVQKQIDQYLAIEIGKCIFNFNKTYLCSPDLTAMLFSQYVDDLPLVTNNELKGVLTFISSQTKKKFDYPAAYKVEEFKNDTINGVLEDPEEDIDDLEETEFSPWKQFVVSEEKLFEGLYDQYELNALYLTESGFDREQINTFSRNGIDTLGKLKNICKETNVLLVVAQIAGYEKSIVQDFSPITCTYSNVSSRYIGHQGLLEFLGGYDVDLNFSSIGKLTTSKLLAFRNQIERARELLCLKTELSDFEQIQLIIEDKNPKYEEWLLVPALFPKGERTALVAFQESTGLINITVASLFSIIITDKGELLDKSIHRENLKKACFRLAKSILDETTSKKFIIIEPEFKTYWNLTEYW